MSFGRTRDLHISQFMHDWAIDEDSKPKKFWRAPAACTVTSARISSSAAVAAADTNYNTFALNNGATEVASLANGPASGGVAIAIEPAGGAMTLSATLASRRLAAGDRLSLQSTKTGNGLAVADMGVEITVEFDK